MSVVVVCLSVWLMLMVDGNVGIAFVYFSSLSASKTFSQLPNWGLLVLGLIGITNAICALGLWRWKKIRFSAFNGVVCGHVGFKSPCI